MEYSVGSDFISQYFIGVYSKRIERVSNIQKKIMSFDMYNPLRRLGSDDLLLKITRKDLNSHMLT